MKIKGILIDPYLELITEIQIEGAKQLRFQLRAEDYSLAYRLGNLDIVYCNPYAWDSVQNRIRKELDIKGFMFPEWNYPVLDRAVILGTDRLGYFTDSKTALIELDDIEWVQRDRMINYGYEGRRIRRPEF